MSDETPWIEAPARLLEHGERLAPGVVLAGSTDFSTARMALVDDDFAVRVVEGATLTTRAAAQAAVVAALSLPVSAATNLDALVDALRDLDLWYPRTRRIALLWRDVDVLREADPDGFAELVDILGVAHEELAGPNREDGAQLEEHQRALSAILLPRGASAAPVDPSAPAVR